MFQRAASELGLDERRALPDRERQRLGADALRERGTAGPR